MFQTIRIIFFLLTAASFCQTKDLLYGFSSVPQSNLQNPSVPNESRFYVGMPLISAIHFKASAFGTSVGEVFNDDGVSFTSKLNSVLDRLDHNDFLEFNQQIELINIGYAHEEYFFTGGVYQELDFIFYYPDDFVSFVRYGNNYTKHSLELDDIKFKGELTNVYHFGVQKQVNKKLSFGVRGKLYSSIYNFKSLKNQGELITSTEQSLNSTYSHYEVTLANLRARVNVAGFPNFDDDSSEFDFLSGYKSRALLSTNLGLGLDFGITYMINERKTVTASVLDLGGIFNSKHSHQYEIDTQYLFSGFENSEIDSSSTNIDFNFEEVGEQISDSLEVDSREMNFVYWKSTKINFSYDYKFGSSRIGNCDCYHQYTLKNSLGFQVNSIFRPRMPLVNLTAYYRRKFGDVLDLKLSYTLEKYSKKNIGLGLSLNTEPINFYILANNLLDLRDYYKANTFAFQIGFNIKLKRRENIYY